MAVRNNWLDFTTLKTEEKARNQEMWVATRNWKRHGRDSFLEPLEGIQPRWHLNFSSTIPISRF